MGRVSSILNDNHKTREVAIDRLHGKRKNCFIYLDAVAAKAKETVFDLVVIRAAHVDDERARGGRNDRQHAT